MLLVGRGLVIRQPSKRDKRAVTTPPRNYRPLEPVLLKVGVIHGNYLELPVSFLSCLMKEPEK